MGAIVHLDKVFVTLLNPAGPDSKDRTNEQSANDCLDTH
jgi:hypothetical protein